MGKIKQHKYIILIVILAIIIAVVSLGNKINYKTEIAKQNLALKCQEVYNAKHVDIENTRYNNQKADTIIWSPKTESCLAYYNIKVREQKANGILYFVFEVWDYTNSDLILNYYSYPSKDCIYNGSVFNQSSLTYKPNPKIEASGCYMDLSLKGIDVLTNFEEAMLDLGFKK